MSVKVNNVFPSRNVPRRLAIVGEAPGSDEVSWHVCPGCGYGYTPVKAYTGTRCPRCKGEAEARPTPFVGPSGMLLNRLLSDVGIPRDGCLIANCCQVQPPRNEIKLFKWDGVELTEGMACLMADLATFNPHMILMLGNTPLRGLTGEHRKNVGDWRGSLLEVKVGERMVKAMATYHPAALLREYGLSGVVKFDMKRLRDELAVDGLVLPVRQIDVDLGFVELLDRLKSAQNARQAIAFDLEGTCDYIECIGFASSPSSAFVVPFISVDGTSVWQEHEEIALWEAVAALLEDPLVPKIAQNSLYDCFVLAWTYGIVVRGIADDTMLKHHELYCELDKSLGFQASIYTREPYYKFQRKAAKQLANNPSSHD